MTLVQLGLRISVTSCLENSSAPSITLNPFQEPSLPKAFYHPGSKKQLSKDAKKTALSPSKKIDDARRSERSPSEEMFLSGAHQFSEKLQRQEESPKDSSSKFDETWPSSERPTSLEDNSLRDSQLDFDRFLNLKQRLEFPEKDSPGSIKENETQESTLSKYVERFRKGAPMSRTDRQKVGVSKKQDFWWLSYSPSTSDTALETGRRGIAHLKTAQPRSPAGQRKTDQTKSNLTHAALASHTSSELPVDEETKRLQERTQCLLENSFISELSSGPIVSTDGLGSSPSSTSVVTGSSEERPYRPKFTQFVREKDQAPQMSVPVVPLSRGSQLRPENDVLYQWRLKRRMEIAQDSAHLAPTHPLTHKSVPTRLYPTPQQVTDSMEASRTAIVNSKLAEFRQRLASSLQPQPVQTSSVQFTPAPSTPAPSTPTHTEPKENAEPLPSESMVKQTTAETTKEKDRSTTNPPIASPTLHRKQKLKPDDPRPHLHLMCDILPCPHQEDYGYSHKAGFRAKVDSSDSDTEGDIVESRKDQLLRYKQYLEAERPDSEKKLIKGRRDRHDDSVTAGTSKDKRFEELGAINKQNERKSKSYTHSEDDDSQENKFAHREKGQMSESTRNNQSMQKPLIPDRSRRKNKDRHRERSGKAKTWDTTLPQPKHSSSPKVARREEAPIDSAIGQVVKDHLFDASGSTIASSSVESLPTSHRSTKETTDRKSSQWDGSGISSDGEEFANDNLLQHLRQQRSLYEHQLSEIDNLLAELEGD